MRTLFAKTALVLVVVLGVNAAFAASWAASGAKRTVTTLTICSNNKSPRLLADLMMAQSKQPYLLFPAPQSDDRRFFFCPATGPAYQIPEAEVAQFVRFLEPNRIIVLGGENFVAHRYFDNFDKNIPMFTVEASDWERIAEELEFMLNISGLGKDYKRLRAEMMSPAKIYRPISKPKAPVQEEEKAVEEPVVDVTVEAEAPKAE